MYHLFYFSSSETKEDLSALLAEVFVYIRNYIERKNYCPTCLNGVKTLCSTLEMDVAEEDWENHNEVYTDRVSFFSEWEEIKELAEEPAIACNICMAYFSPEGNTILEREDHELIPYIEVDGTKHYRLPGGGPGMTIQEELPDWSVLNYFSENPDAVDSQEKTWTYL